MAYPTKICARPATSQGNIEPMPLCEAWSGARTDVGGMKQLIGQWMGGLLGAEDQDRMDRGDRDSPFVADDNQSLVGGLSRFLAEILAKLETAYGGAPLDVEISYEMDDAVSPAVVLLLSPHLSSKFSC